MKQYVVDELRPGDYEKIRSYLDANFAVESFPGLYWIDLIPEQYAEAQKEHQACQPFYFALELLPDRLCCELLVRSRQRIRCDCIQHATEDQRNWLIQVVDAVFEQLEIPT
ncbi:MAG: hypothetical protein P8X55_07200 [Desulfosarcinaceae bacterium]|jgi:hypothetical protein